MATKSLFTKLGKEFRKLRIDHDLTRLDMAKTLKISDKELNLIELGKSQATDSFLKLIAETYADNEGHQAFILNALRDAHVESVHSVTFDMGSLTFDQRGLVLELKASIEKENELAIEEAALEAKERKEIKALERAERLAVKKANMPTAKPAPVSVVEDKLSDEDMEFLKELNDLKEAA